MGDSGENGLFSSTESGDDGLSSLNNNDNEKDPHSRSDAIDSKDEDRLQEG